MRDFQDSQSTLSRRIARLLAATTIAVALAASPAAAGEAPARVVSLNVCTDQLALALADPGQVVSVTFLAADANASNVPDQAAALPLNRGRAEEVLVQRPDLVLAGAETTLSTVALLRRLGLEVATFAIPASIAEARAQIVEMARLLGHEDRGRRMLATLDARIAAAARASHDGAPAMLAFSGRGFTSGTGTLIDDLFRRLGLRNMATEYGIRGYGMVPLESLAIAPPDYLLFSDDYTDTPSLAREYLSHPAIVGAVASARRIDLPSRLWSCGGPWLGVAAERLAAFTGGQRMEAAR